MTTTVKNRGTRRMDPVDAMLRGRYAQGSFIGYVFGRLSGR